MAVESTFVSTMTVEDAPYIEYISDIQASVGIRANDYEVFLNSSINTTAAPDIVVEYQGWIVGLLNLSHGSIEDDDISFLSTINVPMTPYDDPSSDLDVFCSLDPDIGIKDIDSRLFVGLINNWYDILEGSFEYEKEFLDTDILSTMNVRILEEADIDGSVSIEDDVMFRDINSCMEVKDISYIRDAIEGNVSIFNSPYSIKLTDGRFVYAKELAESFLDASVIINDFNSWFDVNCRINVPCHRILYSFLSKLKAVRGYELDIPSTLEVFNDQIYDIPGDVNLEQSVYDDLVLDAKATLPPYYYCDIQSNVDIEKVDTRRDFDCYLMAVTPVNTDIEFTMNVESIYHKLDTDIESSINVGNLLDHDINSYIEVLAAVKTNNEFVSRITVLNDLMPCRVGIFVDPLWNYEPFVLKNAVSTFFDRIMNKADVSIVFGGSPRANWDIRHFADVYRIPKYHQHEVPFNFIPTHPLSNRDSMYRFINELFHFTPHDRLRVVDRVFIFSNNTYTHNSTYLAPLYKVCEDYHIPLTVITSKGEFTGTDPSSPTRFISRNPIDPNIPMDRQPHWVFGAGTKHRDVFDDHPIV